MTNKDLLVRSLTAGGKKALEYYGKQQTVRSKGGVDYVAEVDGAVQAEMVPILRRSGYGVLGEEGTSGKLGSKYWIVDPVDGTINFLSGFGDFWCVVGGLIEEGECTLSGIYIPCGSGAIHLAEKGAGAKLGDGNMHVSEESVTRNFHIGTDVGYVNRGRKQALIGKFADEIRYNPQHGSASCALAHVAEGGMDGYVGFDLPVWDLAPGALMVREAGGRASFFPGVFEEDKRVLVAGNPHAYKFLLDRLGYIE